MITWPTVVWKWLYEKCHNYAEFSEFPLANTGVRIADDSPLLSWLLRFAAHVMNKMRIGEDGKTSELRRTGRRWLEPVANFGEKVWFRKIGEVGVSSFASRMTQGIFVSHHDRT